MDDDLFYEVLMETNASAMVREMIGEEGTIHPPLEADLLRLFLSRGYHQIGVPMYMAYFPFLKTMEVDEWRFPHHRGISAGFDDGKRRILVRFPRIFPGFYLNEERGLSGRKLVYVFIQKYTDVCLESINFVDSGHPFLKTNRSVQCYLKTGTWDSCHLGKALPSIHVLLTLVVESEVLF